MRSTGLVMTALVAVSTLTAVEAEAQKADDRLVFLAAREPPSFDFYMQSNREGVILNRMMFDGLVRADSRTGEVTPGLATEWEWLDDTTINFKLREGVTFHNGEPFDASDVVYTLEWNNSPENRTVGQSRTNWMERIDVNGPYDITIHLPRPFPAAMEFLNANFPIYPAEYHAEVGTEGFSEQPVGTGRYKVDSTEIGREIVMSRNENYWAEDNGHIGTVVMRFVPEQNTQTAELMGGNAQLIWQVPPDQATRMERMPTVDVTIGETMRMGYIQFDSGLEGGPESPVHNPLVREAIAHAIDRQAIVDNIMGGGQVLHLPCYPTQFGCEAPGAPTYDYNPERAMELLAEAGYPDGFTIDFHAYRNRPIAEAVMGYLAEVGIEANLQWLQYSALRDAVRSGNVDFTFMAWGSSSINDIANSTSYFFKGGPDDTTMDPDVIEWLTAGDSTVNREMRQTNYSKALTRIMEEVYWVPLSSYAYYYAMSSDLDFTPTPDEIVHLYEAKWK